MRIAIVGLGHIGAALGPLLARAGHEVVYGVERAGKSPPPDTRATSVEEALHGSDAVVVAIPFGAWPAFAQAHRQALTGKTVIDATNTNAERDGEIVRDVERQGNGTLAFVTQLLPASRLVKAFNTMTSDVLARGADQPGGRLADPLAGDDAAALALTASLVKDAGFDPVSLEGGLQARRFDQGTAVWNNPMKAERLRAMLSR